MVIDSAQPAESPKKRLKRKREKQHGEILTAEERERKIESLNVELKSLFKYFKEVLGNNNVGLELHFASCSVNNVNGIIALLLEERSTSYSKLANEIYERVKERVCGVTIANVKSSVLYVGQRVSYGVPNADADVLEDETDSALWCWKEKELKQMQENAEKDEKRCDKEESQMRKQLKRKQGEPERDQHCRGKEEAKIKKQCSIQKQASIMERFLKKSKSNPVSENDQLSTSVSPSAVSTGRRESLPESKDDIDMGEIYKSHVNSWSCLGHPIWLRSKQHWGIRRKPKIEVIKELKLCHSNGLANYEDPTIESLSYRPAFYGIWPKKSNVVGPCHPLKDPDLDYDVDSDEEWEEEDPGESLSDCDKDGEESLGEACMKADEEDESDDGFFVPDGYLSENEADNMLTSSQYNPTCCPTAYYLA
ncbi:hypothetical protein Ancab_000317 [Ancistrocladus abbreviatus]